MRRPDRDQLIRVESGHARVELGRSQDRVEKAPHGDADGTVHPTKANSLVAHEHQAD